MDSKMKGDVKWSFVIPAFNEEKYLPRLLESIKRQDFEDYEVILVDSNSKDKTIKIAREYGCRILKGKRGNPGINRNIGAKNARGDFIVFFDADVILPNGFLRNNTEEFKRRGLDIGGVIGWPIEGGFLNWLIRGVANIGLKILSYVRPSAEGYCIFVKKKAHGEILFDEKVTFAEDMDYVIRGIKGGKRFGILHSSIGISMRRFDKKGKISMSLRYVGLISKSLFYTMKNKIDYEFGKF